MQKLVVGLFLIALFAPREGRAHEGDLAKVLCLRQDLLEGKYAVSGLRDGSALPIRATEPAQLTKDWFQSTHFKLITTQQRLESLFDKYQWLLQLNSQPQGLCPRKLKTLLRLVDPLRSLYLCLKHQKNHLRRYYEKKLTQQQRNLVGKVRLRRYVRMLKYYNEIKVSEFEDRLDSFQSLFLIYTEGLGEPRLQQVEAACTLVDPCQDAPQECVICYEDILDTPEGADGLQLPCHHAFHKDCILPWLHTHNTCPTCRQEVVTTG
ncbi:MAG: RING-H2 finger protein [Zetaproteobacteria bacterium]|nr:RING-H2 finger protein [Zetaproteobacteria bacterium]